MVTSGRTYSSSRDRRERKNSEPPTSPAKAERIVVAIVVTHEHGSYIQRLKPGDFRTFEDGIPQEIFTFAEPGNPAVQLNDEGTNKPVREDAQLECDVCLTQRR